ncbi:MAG TPA: CBS domain-containing protein [Myxococcota bacterium]|nr:CBS domain-containing protein [Myxococcota bacterium]
MRAAIDHYEREVATVGSQASVREAADAMRASGAGSLVVLDEETHPVGILTDRDLLERVIADGRDVGATRVCDVMTQPLQVASPDDPLDRVVEVMSANGVRRVPIVRNGALTGIVTLDDALAALSDELHELTAGRRRAISTAERGARARELAREIAQRAREVGEQLDELGAEVKSTLTRELEALQERIRSRRG